jgi:hypothetical protein
VAVVMIALDRGFLDRAVHTHVKHMAHVAGRWAIGVARRKRELNAVVGEYGVNLARDGFDQGHQEGGRGRSAGLLHKLYEGKFAGPVDPVQVQLAFGRPYLGNVDVEVTDRIGFERFLVWLSPSTYAAGGAARTASGAGWLAGACTGIRPAVAACAGERQR